MSKELLIGIAEAGVMHTDPAEFDIDTRFRMVKEAGVFDYYDKTPPVQDLYTYLATMQQLVDSAGEDSLKISNLIQNIPPQYSKWYFGRFHQPNMKHLFSSRRKEVIPQ